MFLHAGPMHILFNMLGVWMFGTELERAWGTQAFARYYAITGVGAGVVAVAASFLPIGALAASYSAVTIGASGALFGLLLAYAMRLAGSADPADPDPGPGEVLRDDLRRAGAC